MALKSYLGSFSSDWTLTSDSFCHFEMSRGAEYLLHISKPAKFSH